MSDVTDPMAIICSGCGKEHHPDAGRSDEGIRPQCHSDDCTNFLPRPTERQDRLLVKRMEQSALLEDGYVTVGGWIEGVDQSPPEVPNA